MMNTRIAFLLTGVALMAIVLTACGAPATTLAPAMAAPTMAPPMDTYRAGAEPQTSAGYGAAVPAPEQPMADSKALVLPTAGVIDTGKGSPAANSAAGRMVIKNSDMRLQVEDTDVALDRATQVVGDLGGYIISS